MSPLDEQRLIYEMAHRITQAQGLELVEVKIGIHHKDVLIQVLADKPQGGISIEECSLLNRSIVEAIDKDGILSEDGYSLEVASPGLDRPLVTYKDFSRNMNAQVRVWLKEKVAGKVEHEGIIQSVTEEFLTLLITQEQEEIKLPVDQMIKGLLVI